MEQIKVNWVGKHNDEISIDLLVNNLVAGSVNLELVTKNKVYRDTIGNKPYVYLNQIWVDPSHRRQGIGNKLMSNLDSICKKYFSTINDIILIIFPFDNCPNYDDPNNVNVEILQEFYENHGFQLLRGITMHKSIQ